ncbi:MAG: HEAT repeat domain-containing protein [Desulfuromonadaceae bacterium]|nr:HEAT repeat domain-containing protein [Desulfuromonadaceae bacterium]MDD5105423.1 HEAT repeat domain-containing protein [Desulfuromonadaceae bacterium]
MDLDTIQHDFQSSDEEVRRSTLHSLRHALLNDVQETIFSAMGDENWRVRKEAVETYIYLKPDLRSIEQLLKLLRNEDNAGLRNSAAEALIRLGAQCAEPLLSMVQDIDADLRKSIIDIMGAIGEPVFFTALLVALQDPAVNVASAAAEQLGALGDAEAAEYLMKAIVERDEVLFRFSALGSLGALGKQMSIPAALLNLAEQELFKKAVFDCLGSIADESSYKLLLDGFSCRQKNCRAAAVKALYRVYERSPAVSQATIRESLQLLKENDIITGLLELFNSKDMLLTEALLWTSVVTKDNRFIPMLIEGYADERTASSAFAALKNFGRDAVQEIDSRFATLGDCGRSGLCRLISECGYSQFNDVIQKGLRDSSAQVRVSAAFAVGKLGLITMIPELVLLVDDPDLYVFAAAVGSLQSLAIISRAKILTEVGRFCSSEKVQQRKAAALLCSSLGELNRLLLLIKDEDSKVRSAAVTALGKCRMEGSGSALALSLTDEDPEVRIAAADALGMLLDPTIIGVLEHALNDEDVWVQSAVLAALAKIDPARALAVITSLCADAGGLLLITSLKILQEIGGPESENIIRRYLQNDDQDVARQAAASLKKCTTSSTLSR